MGAILALNLRIIDSDNFTISNEIFLIPISLWIFVLVNTLLGSLYLAKHFSYFCITLFKKALMSEKYQSLFLNALEIRAVKMVQKSNSTNFNLKYIAQNNKEFNFYISDDFHNYIFEVYNGDMDLNIEGYFNSSSENCNVKAKIASLDSIKTNTLLNVPVDPIIIDKRPKNTYNLALALSHLVHEKTKTKQVMYEFVSE